ncbi:N-acetyltransferase [Filobacillus milosensis]|uniref:N-acetyltransferase n=1 Tax=Filobacillus milosensis TaxID=94137 RepID=A0A4Y8IUQ5_9BACI|nr:N-acetyltransferase [Filobacillus milosensis]TFB22828.1 N-acetyltransferase [Filobacillus milosensis]
MTITIRQEHPNDYIETENVVKKAFDQAEMSDGNEHQLVEKIRKCEAFVPELSLIAVDNEPNTIVGHVILSKIKIKDEEEECDSLALAPVSVMPDYQKQGIGKSLCRQVIVQAKELGFNSVVVLGDPGYYSKFNFEKASNYNIRAPFEVPDEAFMVLELKDDALKNVSGVVEYSQPFYE